MGEEESVEEFDGKQDETDVFLQTVCWLRAELIWEVISHYCRLLLREAFTYCDVQ